jgi:hypothetical protein
MNKEDYKRILNQAKYYNQGLTLSTFSDLANDNHIPIHIEFEEGICEIYVFCFDKDMQFVYESIEILKPVTHIIEYIKVPKKIEYTQQKVLEYANKYFKNNK